MRLRELMGFGNLMGFRELIPWDSLSHGIWELGRWEWGKWGWQLQNSQISPPNPPPAPFSLFFIPKNPRFPPSFLIFPLSLTPWNLNSQISQASIPKKPEKPGKRPPDPGDFDRDPDFFFPDFCLWNSLLPHGIKE